MAIRAKLVIIFFAFAVLPMFLLTLRWYTTATVSVESLLRGRINNRAQEITDQINVVLNHHRARVSELARRAPLKAYAQMLVPNGQSLPDDKLQVHLGAFLLAHQEQYAALVGVNSNGTLLFKIEAREDPDGVLRAYFKDKSLTDEDVQHYAAIFRAANPDAEVSVSEASGGDSYFNLVTPLHDAAGRLAAALIVELRADQMLTEAAGPHTTANATPQTQADAGWRKIIILNRQKNVLYSSNQAKQGKSLAEGFPTFEPTLSDILNGVYQVKDIYPISDNGRWMIRRFPYNDGPQLSIFVLEKYDDAVGGLEKAAQSMILLTFVLASVATLSLYYLISGTTDSIRRVTRGAKAIAAGKLDHQITVKTRDETRVMADAFNRMAARLRQMIARESEQRQFESFARLSAVLTHDLKNAILSLSLLVSNMERKFDREGFREDAMRTLSDSVDNLDNLVSKLSDPLAQTRATREQEDLNAIVERVLQRTAEQTDERYQITATLLPRLTAPVDAKAIERVVENLVINALEAMPEGGTLRISTRLENEAPVIAVADTGKGMTQEFIRERLFHPFATTKKKGIGLGLYSCHDIIEQHGGRIEVTSQPDAGTEFRIVLPITSTGMREREEQTAAV